MLRRGAEQIVGELRQLARAEHSLVLDQQGWADLGIAVFAGLQVEHELAQRPLQPGNLALEDHKARAAHLGGGFEVHAAQGLAQIDVITGAVDAAWCSDPADLDIAMLINARRHVVSRQVRQGGEDAIQSGLGGSFRLAVLGQFAFQRFDLGHQGGGAGLVLLGLGLADLLAGVVAARLGGLAGSLCGAQGRVQAQNFRRLGRQPLQAPGLVIGVGIFADGLDVVHGLPGGLWRAHSLSRAACRANRFRR
jgi:hypothetical protein